MLFGNTFPTSEFHFFIICGTSVQSTHRSVNSFLYQLHLRLNNKGKWEQVELGPMNKILHTLGCIEMYENYLVLYF